MDALKIAVPQWKNFPFLLTISETSCGSRAVVHSHPIVVLVFDHQSSSIPILNGGPILPHGGNVYEQTCLGVDPPCIDHVQRVLNARIQVVWIDLQEIGAPISDARESIMELSHVVIFCEVMHGWFIDLNVEVRVPRQDLRARLATRVPSTVCVLPFDSTTIQAVFRA